MLESVALTWVPFRSHGSVPHAASARADPFRREIEATRVPAMTRDAVISPCGLYRYALRRTWAPGPLALFCLLNPSTADAEVDDPTVRRGVGFAKNWGFGSMVFVNLFAYRTTKPANLWAFKGDRVGPENDMHIYRQLLGSSIWVAAWGVGGGQYPSRVDAVRQMPRSGWRCLGTTKDGHPKHPLYLAADTPLVDFHPDDPR